MLPKNYNELINDISLLEKYLQNQSEKYYTDGSNELTDPEFDALVDILKSKNPSSFVINKTGWGFEIKKNKIKHKYAHIGSLAKCKSFEEIPERFKNRKVFISPKLDGLSAVVYYKNGNLVKSITRGNGEYGKDITNKMICIIGKEIKDKSFTGAVRGEIIIHQDHWEQIKKENNDLIAPRNYAAGIINRDDINSEINYLSFVVYKIIGHESTLTYYNRSDILNWLSVNFIDHIPNCYLPCLNKESWDLYHEQLFKDFLLAGYGLDGLVLTQEKVDYDKNEKAYKYDEIAFKFNAETAETIITDIEWTISRTDRLVPVAIVEPVELSGAIINRATANNAKWVLDKNIGIGSTIELQRSNEVIPKILDVIEKTECKLPTICPSCGNELIWEGVDLKCPNVNCPSKKLNDLRQWCELVGETDGMQWTLMQQYLNNLKIYTLEDLYQFNYEDIELKLNNTITDQKALQFFKQLLVQEIPLNKALEGANIPRLGNKTVKQLINNKDSLYSLLNLVAINYNLEDKISLKYTPIYQITKTKLEESIKPASTEEVLNNLNKLNLVYELIIKQHIKLTSGTDDESKEKIYIAITGSLKSMKRKDFEQLVNSKGYELTSNLKKCKYLINNDLESKSTKNLEAIKYNIPIISENEFFNIIN